MEKAKIWAINPSKKHSFNPRFRYSVMEYEKDYYLVDNDRAWWGYISPILTWKIPETVMKINLPDVEVNNLLLDKKGQKRSDETGTTVAGLGVFISLVLGPILLFPIIEHFFNFYFPIIVNLFIALIIIIGMLILKFKLSKSAHQVIDVIGKENLSATRMIIFPISIDQKIKVLACRVLFILLALTLFIFLFTESNEMNIFILLVAVVGLFMILYPNIFMRMFAEYSVKIVD